MIAVADVAAAAAVCRWNANYFQSVRGDRERGSKANRTETEAEIELKSAEL